MVDQKIPPPLPDLGAGTADMATEPHPAGRVKYGAFGQAARLSIASSYLCSCMFSVHTVQLIGAPLYFFNKDYFYAYMAVTKQCFGLILISLTQWFSPTVTRVSGDKSVRGQLWQAKDGTLVTDFPERLVMISNHQLYSDWIYLWWISYTSRMHGHLYIILKESMKYIPVIGPGMMFYGFIFMARKWAQDKERLRYRLQKLNAEHQGPLSGSQALDPMWLMIFPEGTNLSGNTRKKSKKWADQQGIKDFEHVLLPRSTGLQYCLKELEHTVDWVYDCTVAYEGIPRNEYGQDIFTLWSTYFQGRPPKSVNMYWRRFPVSSIPVNDGPKFESWLRDRWVEKETLLEQFSQNGRFPADDGQDSAGGQAVEGQADSDVKVGAGFIESEVRIVHWYELGLIFGPLATYALLANIFAKVWNLLMYGNMVGYG